MTARQRMTARQLLANVLYAAGAIRTESTWPWPEGSNQRMLYLCWRYARVQLRSVALGEADDPQNWNARRSLGWR